MAAADELQNVLDTPAGEEMDLDAVKPELDAEMRALEAGDDVGKEINVTPDGGVVKKILVNGEGWEKPETHDIVSVHYVGTLTDGTKFDSSRDRDQPFTFNLGEGSVIKGWDLGVATMKKGEKAVLTCKADYAYGEAGSPPKIPAGATLNFEVELLSWRSVKDISGDGGVIKKVLAEGDGWQKPTDRDEVLVVYSAKVQGSEKPFKASPAEGVEFTLADGLDGLAGVQTALRNMKKGEHVLLTLQPSYAYGASGHEALGVPADAVVEVDLKLLSWKKVEDVTPDGGVVRKVLQESEQWQTPNDGATVTVRLVGKLEDGTVFVSHPEGKELSFVTDEELLPEGLEAGIMKMKHEEKALLTVSPQYGFGEQGATAGSTVGALTLQAAVPANATLQFEVELVEVVKAKESWEMNDAEKVDAAAARKEKANKAYKEGKIARAIRIYDKAANFISYDKTFPDDIKARARDVRKAVQLNLAAAHLKQRNWKAAAEQAGKVLEVEPTNVKALYRHAEALMGSGDFVEAEQEVRRGLLEQPDNTDLAALHRRLKAVMKDQAKKEAALYSKMFKFPPASKSKPAADATPTQPASDAQPGSDQQQGEAAPMDVQQAA